MKARIPYLIALVTVFAVATAFRPSLAAEGDEAADESMDLIGYYCVIAYDLGGANGVESTVIYDPKVRVVGGKRFFGGKTAAKYPEIPVLYPGTNAFIALDRITYVQALDRHED